MILLSRVHYKILYLLSSNPSCPFSVEKIIDYVWGQGAGITKSDLSVYITRLRKILSRSKSNQSQHNYIISLRNVGYIFCLSTRNENVTATQ
ncbi:helix-turn-helix domain-containing protein [Paenibacillus phyllosphaerae]|uniref:helix-turn-helix domain-containing protein n=1 Tax=Paenibacillus phyllosphaerae TaxID=274593 RepID=UPI0033918AAA